MSDTPPPVPRPALPMALPPPLPPHAPVEPGRGRRKRVMTPVVVAAVVGVALLATGAGVALVAYQRATARRSTETVEQKHRNTARAFAATTPTTGGADDDGGDEAITDADELVALNDLFTRLG